MDKQSFNILMCVETPRAGPLRWPRDETPRAQPPACQPGPRWALARRYWRETNILIIALCAFLRVFYASHVRPEPKINVNFNKKMSIRI